MYSVVHTYLFQVQLAESNLVYALYEIAIPYINNTNTVYIFYLTG